MSEPGKLKIHYLKASSFRNISVSGVHGGAAENKQLIFMNIFQDRVPIPQSVTVEINSEGVGKEIEKESKEGVIRDVEACLIMDLNTAILVRGWLDDKIEYLRKKEAGTNGQ